MKNTLLLLLLLVSTLFAQTFNNSIVGKITDESSGEPLAGVNVYFSETTIGSMSNADGNYIIKNIKPGYYDLVVSCIGYEPNNYRLEIKREQKINIDFEMKVKEYSFGEIIVKTESPDEWLAKYEIFERTFLGQTNFTDLCKIENYEKINFEDTEDGFEAGIPEPLIVTNQALGYNIYIELIHYDYSEDEDQWNYEIKPWFNDLDSNATSVQLHNRIETYHGSEREFWNNYDNLFADSSCYTIGIDQSETKLTNIYVPSKNTFNPVHNHLPLLADPDPIILKPEYKGSIPRKLKFESILVQYRPSLFDARESKLTLNHDTLTIDENGYPKEEFPYTVNGYWATLGVANMLPRDFTAASVKYFSDEKEKERSARENLKMKLQSMPSVEHN